MITNTISISKEHSATRYRLISMLKKQGFGYDKNKLILKNNSKQSLRNLNRIAVRHLLENNNQFIQKYDKLFISEYIADGREINPKEISPKLIYLDSKDTEETNLFRWVKLHWSIPISAGYGRRLRYLVMDEYTGKLMGIIGLADPVYALKDRDNLIGWNSETKAKRLRHLMDGFVIGAVPPYNLVLGGKLVASLLASDKISTDFYKKYKNTKSLISGKKFNGKLIAITTSSAFGKSAMYDRISIPNGPKFLHVGWTKGYGEFQFSNGEYQNLLNITKKLGYSGKNKRWGSGPRNRRVVIREALKRLGMSEKLLYHGIKRELFLVPLAKNWRELLIGNNKNIKKINNDVDYISSYMLNRWIIPRSKRDDSYKFFNNSSYSLLRKINL